MARQRVPRTGWSVALWCVLSFGATAAADAIELGLPIDCEIGQTCLVQNYVDHDRSDGASDYRCGALTYDGHSGTDFRLPTLAMQRNGVDVLAVADGRVLRTRDGVADISVSAPDAPPIAGQECGNGAVVAHADGWETQYCHLARGSLRVKSGDLVKLGQPLGQVGLSGKTEFPHVHLTVRLRGEVVDPFAFGASEGSCGGGTALWNPALRESLSYRAPAVLNTGFAKGPVTMEQVEAGDSANLRPGNDAAALVAFVRTIGLRGGDVQRLSITGPDGGTIVDQTEKPLERNKAQFLIFAGRKRPPEGFKPGEYRADYSVVREGKILLQRTFEVSL
ncbi:M23 family metallopeptidase [Reyranella sp.]|uniref:M23 family metallopeptidase n=1 Tax=Reyranella sp. TaxID=1929291 RepID=UPI003D0C1A60